MSFDCLVECWRVRAIGLFVTRDWTLYGFTSPVEVFPKSIGETEKHVGGWLRMVGHHHKRPHWSRILDLSIPAWLDGEFAVDHLLHHTLVSTYRESPLVLEYWERLMVKVPRSSQNVVPVHGGGPPVEQLKLTRTQLRDLERCRSALVVCEDLTNPEILRVAAALRAYGLDGRRVFLDWPNPVVLRHIGDSPRITIRLVTLSDSLISGRLVVFDLRNEITIGSIYHYAASRGWVKPWAQYR